MHAAEGERGGQTVNSLVSELRGERAVHWVTGTAAPCSSIFKPVFADAPPPAHGPRPTDHFDPRVLWWRHERLPSMNPASFQPISSGPPKWRGCWP